MSEETTTVAPETAPEPAAQSEQPAPEQKPTDTDGTDYKALAAKAQADAEKWRGLARKHEERAKANADAANGAKTLQERLEAMEKAAAERDVLEIQRAGRLGITQVQAKLAANGFSTEDVAGLLELIDPVILLKEGEPDDEAIEKLTASLIKVGGRTTPDPDQGRKGGEGAADMNSFLRKMAGR